VGRERTKRDFAVMKRRSLSFRGDEGERKISDEDRREKDGTVSERGLARGT